MGQLSFLFRRITARSVSEWGKEKKLSNRVIITVAQRNHKSTSWGWREGEAIFGWEIEKTQPVWWRKKDWDGTLFWNDWNPHVKSIRHKKYFNEDLKPSQFHKPVSHLAWGNLPWGNSRAILPPLPSFGGRERNVFPWQRIFHVCRRRRVQHSLQKKNLFVPFPSSLRNAELKARKTHVSSPLCARRKCQLPPRSN